MSKPEKFQIIVNRLLKSNSYEMKAPEYLNFFESMTENIENTLFFSCSGINSKFIFRFEKIRNDTIGICNKFSCNSRDV